MNALKLSNLPLIQSINRLAQGEDLMHTVSGTQDMLQELLDDEHAGEKVCLSGNKECSNKECRFHSFISLMHTYTYGYQGLCVRHCGGF